MAAPEVPMWFVEHVERAGALARGSRMIRDYLLLGFEEFRFAQLYGSTRFTERAFEIHSSQWNLEVLQRVAGSELGEVPADRDSVEYRAWFLWMTLWFMDRCDCLACLTLQQSAN